MGIPMNRELQVFQEECQRPSNVPEISAFVSLEDFKKRVQRWKETTSTSPSGRHHGHYQTAILDDEVVKLLVDMINFSITHGFAPDRWTHSVTPLMNVYLQPNLQPDLQPHIQEPFRRMMLIQFRRLLLGYKNLYKSCILFTKEIQ